MSQELYTVEQAAELLRLHAKTVLRAIHEGRLPANRMGKSYRIQRQDLEAFGGIRPGPRSAARVTSIVDIPDIEPERAARLTTLISSARMGGDAHPDPMSVSVAHDPVRRHLKVVLIGSPADTLAMLPLIQACLEP
jgi:excisionase family DNA binding protein